MYIVKVYADEQTINDIASRDDGYTLEDYGVSNRNLEDKFNNEFGEDLPLSEWNNRFRVGE